ncbi:MAG: hypothetical protein ACRCZF_14840 [Gemmataceae bacterium]
MNTAIFTGDRDKNGIPIAVGDLVRMKHFIAARKRQVYMYKRVSLIDGKVFLSNLTEDHRCFVKDAGPSIEVIDGPSIDHPKEGWLVCWWERKRLKTFDGLTMVDKK